MTETRPVGVGRVGADSFLLLLVDCAGWVIRPAGEARAYKDNAKVACWLPTEPKKPFSALRARLPSRRDVARPCVQGDQAGDDMGTAPRPVSRQQAGASAAVWPWGVARDWSKSRSCIVRVGPGLTS